MIWDTGPDIPFLLDRPTPPQRLNARSPWYDLDGQRVELLANYCGWDTLRQQRIAHLPINEKVRQMIWGADELIVASFFLFDNLYADEPVGGWSDYSDELADLLIAKKADRPSLTIVLILDLFHKGWGHRHSAVVDRLRKAGVDVFYSDLLETRPAQRLGIWEGLHRAGRQADLASDGLLALPWNLVGRTPIPGLILDKDMVTVSAIANAALFKANHRKALVVKRRGIYEALTTSWNPHNPSLLHENHAISVTGPLACYMYLQLREDVSHSLSLGRDYASLATHTSADRRDHYLQRQLPPLPDSAWRVEPIHHEDTKETKTHENDFLSPFRASSSPSCLRGAVNAQACVATEEAIEPILMRWLSEVEADDQVRIQMFYLSRVPVVSAILDAARRTKQPIRILLDPNRVGINYSKDATPNAQVAAYLLQRAAEENARLEIRWYATHGEQNHAKAITITNPNTGKYLLSLGSANWTRKNLAGINMENNIFIRNAPQLNGQFNTLFDRQWFNTDPGIEYSVAWDDPRYNYHHHKSLDCWAVPRYSHFQPLYDDHGRPQLLEQELVHW